VKLVKNVTNRQDHSLDRYLNEIGKVDLLSADEEVELARRIKKGDQQALETLTKANLRFVVSVAKQYQSQGLTLGDLINEGNLGLIKAAHRFDETRGFKFISYAVWWIRQSILQAIAEHSRIVRLPLNRIGTLNKIGRAYSNLEQEFEREPSPSELAQELKMDVSQITDSMKHIKKHISMDAPFVESEENRLLDVIQNDEFPDPDFNLMLDSLKIEIDSVLQVLSGKEADVLKMYFGLSNEQALTLEEIGDRFNITRERVRQIKDKAIRRLRRVSKSKNLKTYLG
jgi:RNA polymerase primary sigma factor